MRILTRRLSDQFVEHLLRSPEYVPDPMELEDHVPVYILEPEHPEDLVPAEDEAPTPLLPPFFLSPRIRPLSPRALEAEMRDVASSLYHSLHPSRTPPSLPIPLLAPSPTTSYYPEADTPPIEETTNLLLPYLCYNGIVALIDRGVAAAMTEAEASRVRNGYDSNGSGPRPAQAIRECSYSEFLKYKPFDFKVTEGVTTTPEVAHAMPWATLKKMMTGKYCSRGKIKKIETEMWNLKVKGTDVVAYIRRF
ncbi:hypothetical protein Tco_1375851 [Tanacetum coccineum]